MWEKGSLITSESEGKRLEKCEEPTTTVRGPDFTALVFQDQIQLSSYRQTAK